ncbi:caspase family protein [Candidatus Halobeggiatoa sp. HSG11]|nr:caspase family protein [Candidatus Halobeggiatoa sp. HSG11]
MLKKIFTIVLFLLAATSQAEQLKLYIGYKTNTDHHYSYFENALDVRSIDFSPDGQLFLSSSGDMPKLWNVKNGQRIRSFYGHSVGITSVDFSPDGRLALSCDWDGIIKLWDINSGKEIRNFQTDHDNCYSVVFSPNGQLALSSGYGIITLWDVNTGRKIRNFQWHSRGHSQSIDSIVFSPDGQLALSICNLIGIKLWDVNGGQEIHDFSSRTGIYNFTSGVAFSPDGRMALSASDLSGHNIKLWDINSKRGIREFKGHLDNINSAVFSPDGRLALSGSDDQMIKLWNVNSGQEIKSFKGHLHDVDSVAFSPDGRLALSGSDDGSSRFWNIKTGEEIAQMVSFEDGEWITITKQGYYVASTGGKKYIKGTSEIEIEKLNRPNLVAAILQAGELDRQAPRIELTGKQRGVDNELVVDTYQYALKGRAIDQSGIASIIVNGKSVNFDNQGSFSANLALQAGSNPIHIKAADIFDNQAEKHIVIAFSDTKPKQQIAGNNYALVIGINDYQDSRVTTLDTPVNDAQAIAKLLKNNYGFQVTALINAQATRNNILAEFGSLTQKTQANDNLLVFYAGHGQRDLQKDKAYWFPFDARAEAEYTWIIADRITSYMKGSQATNVLVIADSCYSGAIGKVRNFQPWQPYKERYKALKQLQQTKYRILIASGGDVPVSDGRGGQHSLFAAPLIEALQQFKNDFTAHELFLYVQQKVAGDSSQIQGIHFIRNSGHQGGDFVFERLLRR